MPTVMLPFNLVEFADTRLRDPELKPLIFRPGRFQTYRVGLFVYDIQQARNSPTSFVSVAKLLGSSAR